MPLIEVTIAEGRTDEQKKALLTAVTNAVHETIDAPIDSIRVWISEMRPTHYMAAGELLADKRARVGS
jgi:4-oxalocrotonate tautomerase